MKILMVYSSLTGNTKKIADYVYSSLKEKKYEIDFIKVNEANKYDDVYYDEYDVILLCFWCRRSSLDPMSMKLLEKVKEKRIFLIGTMGSYPDSEYGISVLNNVKDIIEKGNIYLGCFLSQGKINPERTEKRRNLPKSQPHYLDDEGYKRHLESRKHPNSDDLKNAENKVLEILKDIQA